MSEDPSGTFDIHLRAFTEASAAESTALSRKPRRPSAPGYVPTPGERDVLVFDTETTIDTRQRLTFGVWRLCREILDERGRFVRLAVREEGILHTDDLPRRDPRGFAVLQEYARTRQPTIDPDRHWVEPPVTSCPQIVLQTRSWFVEERLFKCAYKRKAPIVGFHLAFDLSRIALDWRPATDGGFSLYTHVYLSGGKTLPDPYRPRLHINPIDGHRSLIQFGVRLKPDPGDADGNGRPWRGEFVDLHPLVLGLTGEKHSLKSGGEAMGCEIVKRAAEEHGVITPEYVDYARHDVASTQDLYERCRIELERHPIGMPAHRVFSSAGIGKGYLRTMRAKPRLELQPDFDRSVLGASASSYGGGRVEAAITGSVPVRYLDVLSMYPTVNVLLGLWELVVARRVKVVDATEELRELLERIKPEDLLSPGIWPEFVGIAKLGRIGKRSQPVLPLRCPYTDGSSVPNIGLNRLASPHDGWYAIPDLISSKLRTGLAPRIERAVRLVPVGRQRLKSVKLRGEVAVDPRVRDFFTALIEERQCCKRRGDRVNAQGLKIIANSTAYGIYMEMLRDEVAGSKLKVLDVHTATGSFTTATNTPELPRDYCFPPIATLITSGARLILAMIEHAVREAGGVIAYMDTDSVAIVSTRDGGAVPCAGGRLRMRDGQEAVHALPHEAVDRIAASFEALNPYDRRVVRGSILELEPENNPPHGGRGSQLCAFILGSKRYALYNVGADGRVIIRKFSEHGLGMRLDPTDPRAPVSAPEDDELVGGVEHRDRSGSRRWIEELWRYLIERHALGRDVREPDWFDRPALSRIAITRPDLARRLKRDPFNFCLVAQIHGYAPQAGESLRLIAPFEPNPRRWKRMRWTDAASDQTFRIATLDRDGYAGSDGNAILVKSYRGVAIEFLSKPEAKLQPVGARSPRGYRGLHERRVVTPGEQVNIGKEANRIEDVEAGLLRADEVLNRYAPRDSRDAVFERVRPIVCAFSPARVAHETGISARTIERVRAGGAPTRAHRSQLLTWGVGRAADVLRANQRGAPSDPNARLKAWEQLPARAKARTERLCDACTGPLTSRQRRYCSEVCRSRARRRAAKPGDSEIGPIEGAWSGPSAALGLRVRSSPR
jgi:hypothetical protein